ncbi:hypothetical protein ADIWIN_2292 [Winogradskyella psychrotolerans RS-3]|uniref:Uncharacterized protein n=1 Tax=Winogradskyella psychrotolerans RS-3 TaxID=641526 RepID=S7X0Z9_9FLAO|nr:hypothetical protein [Winogradskyella psychrotolerans]EPR72679.1 hypothetical protein ADIWIN_2292 [Winogradskyella psychrotolerans RS-3]
MAPIKFEENIKDKLEKRTLSPSSEGWSKLSERLDAEDNKSKKPMFWWLSIAAGLLIMIAISIPFFSTPESEMVLPQIVEEEVIEQQLNNEILKPNQKESINVVVKDKNVEDKKEDLAADNKSNKIDYKKTVNKKSESQDQLANTGELKRKRILLNEEERLNNEAQRLLKEAKLKIAVAEAIVTLKSEKTSVTDREIDSLLKMASKELFKQNIQNESSRTVDANNLLMSVEDEMGQSFRSKVFEALKESYGTVKTAVANRNN